MPLKSRDSKKTKETAFPKSQPVKQKSASNSSSSTTSRSGNRRISSPAKTGKTALESPRPTSLHNQRQGETGALNVGDPAPAFSLPDDRGKIVHSSSLRGKKVILYFYPKDDTPGCTTEACAFRDDIQQLKKKGAVVFGVSADSVASHRKFAEKFQLNFPLLSDESKDVIQAYGVWKEKSMYGKKYMGIERTTVIINEDGTIRKVFPKVKVNEHVSEVLEAL